MAEYLFGVVIIFVVVVFFGISAVVLFKEVFRK